MADEWSSAILSEGFMGLKLIGTGSQSRVYSAYDKKLDNMVTIKKLDISTSAQGEQLKREIAAIKKARHINIVPIFYALVRPRMALLVIAPKPGNLYAVTPLRYDMNVKISAFYCLTIQMLSALTYLQEEGVSHRNVKPSNILFDINNGAGFHFQLTDFALPRPVDQSDKDSISFIYKAPETHTDTYPLTTKQDVWSLFVTLAIACGCLHEGELSRRGPVGVAWAVVEAGVRMCELEAMAQQNPTLRASASVMFHQLRPKERVSVRGEVEYPEVSPEYVGLYGSGRLEKDTVPLGPNADVRTLIGPLGVGLDVPALATSVPEQYQYLPSGLGLLEESTTVVIETIYEGMPSSPDSDLQQQADYEHYRFPQYDTVNQRCLASCCNPNTPRSLSCASSSQPLSPHAPSFVPVSPPLAPTTPQPLRPLTPTEAWDIWGVYKITSTFSLTTREYVRPYPMACDRQDDQDMEDAQLEDSQWADEEDEGVGLDPWQSPPLSFIS